MQTNVIEAIKATAALHRLDAMLIMRVVIVESAGNPWAWNPEPRYRYFWDMRVNRPFRTITAEEQRDEFPPIDFRAISGDNDQEWWAQQASWGLMQVMGAVAREHGFRGSYLTELLESVTGLHYGCLHLGAMLRWADGDVERALAAYNGGTGGNARRPFRNAEYAEHVLGTPAELLEV